MISHLFQQCDTLTVVIIPSSGLLDERSLRQTLLDLVILGELIIKDKQCSEKMGATFGRRKRGLGI